MPEIKHVIVTTRNPNPDDRKDVGDCQEGWFFVEGETLTLCSATGEPLRNAAGERMTARIVDGTTPRQVAARLVLSRWRSERDASDGVPGFNRPLHYRTSGWT
jgi:hypothetical protein